MNDVSVVIPVYKEDPKILTQLYRSFTSTGAEVIVVDDGNTMTDLKIPYYTYYPHMGYGYAIKSGINLATRPFILTMDGDGQHTFFEAQKLYRAFKLTEGEDFDMIVGMRHDINEDFIRWLGRKTLNFLASLISTHYLIDLNSGLRIFKRDLAVKYSPILCDTFSFTTSLTMAMLTDGYKAFYFPIKLSPRTMGSSHVKVVKDGFVTLYYILWIGLALKLRKIRAWLRNIFAKSV